MLPFFLIPAIVLSVANASLHSHFQHFEEILPHNIRIRQKRDTIDSKLNTKLVDLDIFGKKFRLQLIANNSIFSPDFGVHLVDSVGRLETAHVIKDGLYSGFDLGDDRYRVNAINDGNAWFFYIKTPEDVFIVEPAWRLDPLKTQNELVAYKSSDVIAHRTKSSHGDQSFCGVSKDENLKRGLRRKKRKTSNNKVTDYACGVFVVVDYETYRGVGRNSIPAIVKWLGYLFQNVDSVLRHTDLNVDGNSYGVKISGIMIHEKFTEVENDERHYNMANNNLRIEATIDEFMLNPNNSKHCLAHLITQRSFGGPLGIAKVPDETGNYETGICASSSGDKISGNVGLTTPVDDSGTLLPIDTHVMTISHMIGHNFGARHDKEESCTPKSSEGGKFLMWPFIGSQKGTNRKTFSPKCSVPSIKDTLKRKAKKCFKPTNVPQSEGLCGNGVLDPGEDCDHGSNQKKNNNCCTQKCRYAAGASCSQRHHPCCSPNCKVAPKSVTCLPSLATECRESSSQCDGLDAFTCPESKPKPDGDSCGDNSTCLNGRCLSFCEKIGRLQKLPGNFESCNCEEKENMCKHCCIDKRSAEMRCQPMGGMMANGKPCLNGVCEGGICTEASSSRFGKINKAQSSGEEEKDTDSTFPYVTITFTFIAVGAIMFGLVATLTKAGTDNGGYPPIRTEDSMDDIEELRAILENLIGHLNVSPDEEDNPSTKMIRQHIQKEKDSQKKEKGKKGSFEKEKPM